MNPVIQGCYIRSHRVIQVGKKIIVEGCFEEVFGRRDRCVEEF